MVAPASESWVEKQIRMAQERGDFDALPGQGEPLANLDNVDDENWWLKQQLEREGLRMPLPTTLSLRKEIDDLPRRLAGVTREPAARDIIDDLNERIKKARRLPVDGPSVVLTTVDEDAAIARWKTARDNKTR